MHQHTYLTRIDDQTFLDLKRVKELEGRSINFLINEGALKIVSKKSRGRMKKAGVDLGGFFAFSTVKIY